MKVKKMSKLPDNFIGSSVDGLIIDQHGTKGKRDRRKGRLLRMKDVVARTGLSTATINRREASGSFPKREHIGLRSIAWYESDIDDFIADPLGYRS